MDEDEETAVNEQASNKETAAPEQPDSKPAKEGLYDRIPLTKKQLDVIIVILVAAIIVFLVIGALVGNRIL